jgi:hypothetical protein
MPSLKVWKKIDPHFLLTVWTYWFFDRRKSRKCATVYHFLSKIYRYVLEQKDKELVSDEELVSPKPIWTCWKCVLKTVFYDLPATIINPEAKSSAAIAAIIVRNTVKHNSEWATAVVLDLCRGRLLSSSKRLSKKEVLQERQALVLQNIINRYGIITKEKYWLPKTKTFTVKIPILTKQIIVMDTTTNYNENNAYKAKKKRVEELKGFTETHFILLLLFLLIFKL